MNPADIIPAYFDLNDRQKVVHFLQKLPSDSSLIKKYVLKSAQDGKNKMLFDLISAFPKQSEPLVFEAFCLALVHGHPKCSRILSTFCTKLHDQRFLYTLAFLTHQDPVLDVLERRWGWAKEQRPAFIDHVIEKCSKQLNQYVEQYLVLNKNVIGADAWDQFRSTRILDIYFHLNDHAKIVFAITRSLDPGALALHYVHMAFDHNKPKLIEYLLGFVKKDDYHECVNRAIVCADKKLFAKLWKKNYLLSDEHYMFCAQLAIEYKRDDVFQDIHVTRRDLDQEQLMLLAIERDNKHVQKYLVSSWKNSSIDFEQKVRNVSLRLTDENHQLVFFELVKTKAKRCSKWGPVLCL